MKFAQKMNNSPGSRKFRGLGRFAGSYHQSYPQKLWKSISRYHVRDD